MLLSDWLTGSGYDVMCQEESIYIWRGREGGGEREGGREREGGGEGEVQVEGEKDDRSALITLTITRIIGNFRIQTCCSPN